MIIVSITGPTMKVALMQMSASLQYTDMFEFRLDMIKDFNIPVLLVATKKPSIFTCRPVWEGGQFGGTEQKRLGILATACMLGAAYVDIELKAWREFQKRFSVNDCKTKTIVSLHKFKTGKCNPHQVYKLLSGARADIIKFAFQAEDAGDNVCAFEFLSLARRNRCKAIAIAMGEAGEASRVLYRKFGGWATYASAETGDASASGQIGARQLKEIYRADTLTRTTKVYGVIGNPLAQSKGVMLHNPLFHRAAKDAVYCRFRVKKLARFMNTVAPLLNGFSVTIPHKQSIMAHLDNVDETGRAIGAVNTVIRRSGRLRGTNTDAPGALDAIEDTISVRGKQLLVLGAGGAARAIIHEACARDASVTVANRTARAARRLASEFKIKFVAMKNLGGLKFDILANATSVGMVPDVNNTPIRRSLLRCKVVFDAVYNPPVTKLLRDAKQAGAKAVSGTEMYVNQAALQSELYCGAKPNRRQMKKLLGL